MVFMLELKKLRKYNRPKVAHLIDDGLALLKKESANI